MKIFSAQQIKEADAYTIEHEPISSLDLMERASTRFCEWFIKNYAPPKILVVFAGMGNNGGDGLAIARLLSQASYKVQVHLIRYSDSPSEDFVKNEQRLRELGTADIFEITAADREFWQHTIRDSDIVIDALWGSGLNRPIEGFGAEIIAHINERKATASNVQVVSVDVPSGLPCDSLPEGVVVNADTTVSFESPKLAFMMPDNHPYVGKWEVVPIGLHPEYINKTVTDYSLTGFEMIRNRIKRRGRFDHKGHWGHGLFIGGSYGKTGAAILATRAAMRSGIGLLTAVVPGSSYGSMQSSNPECMLLPDSDANIITAIPELDAYSAVGIGPGLGTDQKTAEALHQLLTSWKGPLVVDADALNILSGHHEWMAYLPDETIITPHPGELNRLAGTSNNGFERLQNARELAGKHSVVCLLKGAHSAVILPNQNTHFNNTGNQGMATAGMGDVLTGMILSLLAQGYSAEDAALVGVFIHGLAGDLALQHQSYEALIASDLIDQIGNAFKMVRGEKF